MARCYWLDTCNGPILQLSGPFSFLALRTLAMEKIEHLELKCAQPTLHDGVIWFGGVIWLFEFVQLSIAQVFNYNVGPYTPVSLNLGLARLTQSSLREGFPLSTSAAVAPRPIFPTPHDPSCQLCERCPKMHSAEMPVTTARISAV